VDVPEKIYTEENVKLWRFKTPVLDIPPEGSVTEFRAEGPVPIMNGETKVGFANIEKVGDQLVAEVVADYSLPERLDVQNGTKVWLVPKLQVQASVEGTYADTNEPCQIPTVVMIKHLEFSTNARLYVPCIEAAL
jgi:hypothetical protein